MQSTVGLQIGMCLMLLWLDASPALAVAQSSSDLCAERWKNLFQQPLSSTEMPKIVDNVLKSHQGQGLAAHFTEEKRVTLLKHPLRSTGELVFLPNTGLYRQVKTPFEQEIVITPDAIHQRDESGRTETLTLAALPAAQAFVKAFLSVFSGTLEALHSHFRVYVSAEPQQWQLGFKPKQNSMHHVIACIVLEGSSDHVTAFWVQETNGDVTSDQLTASRRLAPDQWTAYRAYFAWALTTEHSPR